jgi:hypothetical protein
VINNFLYFRDTTSEMIHCDIFRIKPWSGILPINVETLLGHSGGLKGANTSCSSIPPAPIPLFTAAVRSVIFFLTSYVSHRAHDDWGQLRLGPGHQRQPRVLILVAFRLLPLETVKT